MNLIILLATIFRRRSGPLAAYDGVVRIYPRFTGTITIRPRFTGRIRIYPRQGA